MPSVGFGGMNPPGPKPPGIELADAPPGIQLDDEEDDDGADAPPCPKP